MSGGDPALVKQCLDFCQALASMGQTISISLTLGSNFSFNLDTRRKAASSVEKLPKKKKLSPSTLRRNLRRKEEFLKKKSETSKDMETTCMADTTFQCEHCETHFKTEKGLRIHIGKVHKTFKEILVLEKFRDKPLDTSLTVSPIRDTIREEKEIEVVEEVPPVPVEDIVQIVKEDMKPYELEFNHGEKWQRGEIPPSYLKVQLPKPPPMKVKHEILGLGEFVQTHPFGRMSSYIKGPRSHQYNMS